MNPYAFAMQAVNALLAVHVRSTAAAPEEGLRGFAERLRGDKCHLAILSE